MKRILTGTAVAAIALASGTAMAQSDDGVAVSREVIDLFVTGEELVETGTISEGECVPTSDEEFMRTGVETICAERGGPGVRTYRLRNNAPTPTPAAAAPRRQTSSNNTSRQTTRRAPRPRPTIVRIPENCAPTQSESLNMCLTFGLGSSDLTQNARNQIREFAESLIENESSETFIIAGHTDMTGEAARNCELSQSRANSVVAYMVELGVPADHLRPVGFGQDRLQEGIAATDPRHRRVEIERGDADAASSAACSIASAQADPA